MSDFQAAIQRIIESGYTPERILNLIEADIDCRCIVFHKGFPVVSAINPPDEKGFCRCEVYGVIAQKEFEDSLLSECDKVASAERGEVYLERV